LNDHLNSQGLANDVDALRRRVLTNPEWASARPGSDGAAAAALLSHAFEAIETSQGASELAVRAEREALTGELDPAEAARIREARLEIDARRLAASEVEDPAA
jgi:hypothetical protein